jgi:VWFA-related protein
MLSRRSLAVALPVLPMLLAVPLPAQEGRPQPTFPSDVELVAVDVNVVDGDGNPVRDLAAADFRVKVDGVERRVLSADFVEASGPAPAAPAGPAAAPLLPEAAPVRKAPGRRIVFAIDRGYVSFGALQMALESAQAMIEKLAPEDQVAVYTLPTGPRVAFTTDRAAVRKAFDKIGPIHDQFLGQYKVGLAEAMRLVAGDGGESLTTRECADWLSGGRIGAFEGCRVQVEAQARQMVADQDRQVRERLLVLERLCGDVAPLPGTKILVLLSAGLTSPWSAAASEVTGRMQRVAAAAAAARVTLYSLHIRQLTSSFDASNQRRSYTAEEDEQMRTEGLEALTGMAGGTQLDVVAAGQGTFARLAREISGHYLLALEPGARDRDGRSHSLSVDVTRRRLQVRARRQFVLGPGAATEGRAAVAKAPPLPLRLSALTVDGGMTGKVKVLLTAETEGATPARFAYRIVDAKGKVAKESTTTVAATGASLRFEDAVLLAPGDYTLKLGVRDALGNHARAERPLHSRLTARDGLAVSDLMVFERNADGLRLLAGSTASAVVAVYVELYPQATLAPDAVRVTVEVLPPAGAAGGATALPVHLVKEGPALFAEGQVSLPGAGQAYTIRALVDAGSGPVAIERTVERR